MSADNYQTNNNEHHSLLRGRTNDDESFDESKHSPNRVSIGITIAAGSVLLLAATFTGTIFILIQVIRSFRPQDV